MPDDLIDFIFTEFQTQGRIFFIKLITSTVIMIILTYLTLNFFCTDHVCIVWCTNFSIANVQSHLKTSGLNVEHRKLKVTLLQVPWQKKRCFLRH